MEQLSRQDERTVLKFNGLLWGISGPNDMFPPDESGDRAEIIPIEPLIPAAAKISIDGVAKVIHDIDLVLSGNY